MSDVAVDRWSSMEEADADVLVGVSVEVVWYHVLFDLTHLLSFILFHSSESENQSLCQFHLPPLPVPLEREVEYG